MTRRSGKAAKTVSASIGQLPDEIIGAILVKAGEANGGDLLQTRLVCRQWKVLSSKAPSLTWRLYGEGDAAMLVSFLLSKEREGVELELLSLVLCDEALCEVQPVALMLSAALRHIFPQKLAFRTCGQCISKVHQPFSNAQSGELNHALQSVQYGKIYCEFMQNPRLQELQIKGRYEMCYRREAAFHPGLKTLRLVKLEITPTVFQKLLDACPKLEILEWVDLVHPKLALDLKSDSLKRVSGKEEFFCRYGNDLLNISGKNLTNLDVDYGFLVVDAPRLKELNASLSIFEEVELPKLLRLTLRGGEPEPETASNWMDSIRCCPRLQFLDLGMQGLTLPQPPVGLSTFVSSLPLTLQVLHIDAEVFDSMAFEPLDGDRLSALQTIRVYNLFEAFSPMYANLRGLIKACSGIQRLELLFVVDTIKVQAARSLIKEDFKQVPVVSLSVQR